MKRTFQPKKIKRKKMVGFLKRNSYRGGKKIIQRQIWKKEKKKM